MDLDKVIVDIDEALAAAELRPAPVVGGRWTLYTGELPSSAIGGGCVVTGKPVEPGARFVDIGFEVTDSTPNGDVCLHEEYVRELGFAVGLVAPEALERANEQIADLAERLREAEAELDHLRNIAPEAQSLDDIAEGVGRIEVALAELSRSVGSRKAKSTKGRES